MDVAMRGRENSAIDGWSIRCRLEVVLDAVDYDLPGIFLLGVGCCSRHIFNPPLKAATTVLLCRGFPALAWACLQAYAQLLGKFGAPGTLGARSPRRYLFLATHVALLGVNSPRWV
jgi:hypothetical protein